MKLLAAVVLLIVAIPFGATGQANRSIEGTWRLVSFESRDGTGAVSYPLGRNAVGLLIYDAAGNMAVQLMQPNLPHFAANDWLRRFGSLTKGFSATTVDTAPIQPKEP